MIKKVSQHIVQNEPLLFEHELARKRGYQLPDLDVPAVDAGQALGAENVRTRSKGFLKSAKSKPFAISPGFRRGITAIDLGLYPLGSCTMKYNPRVNEAGRANGGFGLGASLSTRELSQGCMEIIAALEKALAEITGMDAVTLQPAAGAHGEFTGILMIRALFRDSAAIHARRFLFLIRRTARILQQPYGWLLG